jgi:predicted ATPase
VRRLFRPLTRAISELKIPPTVQGILAARIDRLPPNAKDLLQALAVIGREFPLSLIRAVLTKTDDELSALLNDLQLREFIYEQPAVRDTEFIFKHALTQEVAYNSVLIERRKQLRDRIGAAIETLFADRLEDRCGELARHYRLSRDARKAIHYLGLAGEQATSRCAPAEASQHFRAALDALGALPEGQERDRLEFSLQVALGSAMTARSHFSRAAEALRPSASAHSHLAVRHRSAFANRELLGDGGATVRCARPGR